ncbi:EboA domain-containing protein [Nocardiopsis chromatogenes]|uniref:EboA domain-containing protein n=1 Tax=Nocardiopsis chromatogenes TaxID=280239 RepID=UPI00034AD21E|nr:EboA domain-containing protein [Nocardiopsis chromatogenes]
MTGDPAPRTALAALVERVRREPGAIGALFPAVGREVGRGPGPSGDPDGILGPTVQDEARTALVSALAAALGDTAPDRLAEEVEALYRFGDAEEKRAVLRSLPALPGGGAASRAAAGVLADALRGNDPRLIAAALGTPAAAALDDHAWRHGVLKCLFSGVPLGAVHRLAERADAELGRMAAGYAAEREAAGRDVPDDARRLLSLAPQAADGPAGADAPPTDGETEA